MISCSASSFLPFAFIHARVHDRPFHVSGLLASAVRYMQKSSLDIDVCVRTVFLQASLSLSFSLCTYTGRSVMWTPRVVSASRMGLVSKMQLVLLGERACLPGILSDAIKTNMPLVALQRSAPLSRASASREQGRGGGVPRRWQHGEAEGEAMRRDFRVLSPREIFRGLDE